MAGPVVIAGGGLAAVRTAQALRDLGCEEQIVLVSAEDEAPYDRPPLSKDYLLGEASDEDIRLLGEDDLAALDLDLQLGSRAAALDLDAGRLLTAAGQSIDFGQLVVATGAAPIQLPAFGGFDNVVYLRDVGDARRLGAHLAGEPRVGIVGGGFIGLEIASVATRLGCEVTVVEAAAEPLAPVLGAEIGGWIRAWHEEQGVAFRCGSPVAEVDGIGSVERLLLADGTVVEADLAVVGVGVRPTVEWLASSGLEVHRGLVCDAHGATSDPRVFGVGDAICRHVEGECRLSGHWTAAGEGARLAAGAMLGQEVRAGIDDGYFWSDQFDKRLQFSGRVPAEHKLELVEGSVQERSFVVRCSAEGQLCAVLALDSPRQFVRNSLELRRARAATA
jgi:3-phenylpropionate/trans-cinnamate dioxygenase ferredoxin reductase subunit